MGGLNLNSLMSFCLLKFNPPFSHFPISHCQCSIPPYSSLSLYPSFILLPSAPLFIPEI